ncbi:hypothetical protein QJS10_CPA01g01647 [Acorus calamus]|uniref:DUF4283 domain-containing protein n=1 Tax=Acorus calamus TaxID=4465 RepID=A0AAV9FLQ7_ACOCL|nr:hypothetical protein QJS10_CPA01g01647 [Acorus calamus]
MEDPSSGKITFKTRTGLSESFPTSSGKITFKTNEPYGSYEDRHDNRIHKELPRFGEEVWANVLQTMLPQQCEEDWLHEEMVKILGDEKPFAPSTPSSLKPPLPPPRKEKQSAPTNSSSVLDPADFHPLQPSKIASQRKPKEQVPLPPPPVSENALCWDQLFPGSTPSSQKLFSLPYFSPSLKNEEMVVDIEDKDCELATEHWANSLVGYIIGTKPVYTPFLQFLHRLWKPKGDFKLLLKGNGFFLVKFFLKEDMQSVLEGGPWTMNNRPFILRQWSPEVKMEQRASLLFQSG